VRALAATLKKGKAPAAGAGARTATAGGGASGAGASGAGARGTAPPIDDDLSNKNIEVCFSITYKERGKKEMTENFCCPGTIESVSHVLSFLAHGPKRACGDVYSLLCALHAVCAELFPPCRRTGPTGPARTSFLSFVLVLRETETKKRETVTFLFSVLYGSA
jgi:hypothetical protein